MDIVTTAAAVSTREASSAEIAAFVQSLGRRVLTFTGYSDAGYEDSAAMLDHARVILEAEDARTTIVNIGATPQGIGAVYAPAKRMGFVTMGIVSGLARVQQVELSPWVDFVFYVADETWGGRLGDARLSPTSSAIVANSHRIVGIGGGHIARDELLAARAAGIPVVFIPADMNHALAIEQARQAGQPPPGDFRGAAHAALMPDAPDRSG